MSKSQLLTIKDIKDVYGSMNKQAKALMCGILGCITSQPLENSRVNAALETLKTRGPTLAEYSHKLERTQISYWATLVFR